jgi:hypothetical protein
VVAETRDRERAIKRQRAADLAKANASCAGRRVTTTKGCADSRSHIRAKARAALARQKDRRREAREVYAWKAGRAAPQSWERKHSRSESDSLAEHNIPAELRPIWKRERKRFDYDRSPDDRAVLFLEWVEENRDDVDAELSEAFEVSDRHWASLEANYYEQHGASAAPF